MSQHLNQDPGDSVQDVLRDFEQNVRSLESRIDSEQKTWLDHLTSSRANGPHGLQQATTIRTAEDVMQQMHSLDQQLQAYNIRVRATCERVAELDELAIEDLVEPEDGRLVSTETAPSYMRRLIVYSRLALNVHGAALRRLEDRMSLAFSMVKVLVSNILHDLQVFEQGETPAAYLRGLGNDGEATILMLKASMARIGIKTARQRVIMEFFAKAGPDNVPHGDATTEQIQQFTMHMPADEIEVESDEDELMYDASDEDEATGDASYDDQGLRRKQTCITDFFVRVPAL